MGLHLNYSVLLHKTDKEDDRTYGIRSYSCYGDTFYGHAKNTNEEEIKENVKNTRYGKGRKRRPGITRTSEDRSFEVIEDYYRKSAHTYPEVSSSKRYYIFRNIHKPEDKACYKLSDDRHNDTRKNRKYDRCMHSLGCTLIVLTPYGVGDDYIGSQSKSYKEIDGYGYQGCISSYGSLCHRTHIARKISYYSGICGIEQLLKDTVDGKAEAVAAAIDVIHADNTSVLKYNDENSLACVLTIAYYAAKKDFMVVRELPAGKGFADIVLLPRPACSYPAILLELKYNQSADTAITQIHERRYAGVLQDYAGEVVLVGINYDKHTKLHECKVERMSGKAS